MSDLLDHLHALQPASLWTLAPKPQLMQAAGMIAVGDIADLHWTGTGQLEIEFPQRMDTLIHRLRLEQRHLVGSCDQHRPQPNEMGSDSCRGCHQSIPARYLMGSLHQYPQ